jgi:hypothetical protein
MHSLTTYDYLLFDSVVAPSGSVTDVQLLKLPHPEQDAWRQLAGAWRAAILGWRYTPPTADGRPVAVCVTVSVGEEYR